MRQGGLILAAGSVRSKKKRNPQQPGDPDHLETARDETRPTRLPILPRFHRYRVRGNRPRTAVAISKNDEFNVTHTNTHIPTD